MTLASYLGAFKGPNSDALVRLVGSCETPPRPRLTTEEHQALIIGTPWDRQERGIVQYWFGEKAT